MNANDVTLTGLAIGHTGSRVQGHAPSAPAGGGLGQILRAAAGGALDNSAAPRTLTISETGLTRVSRPWPPQIPAPGFRCGQPLETQRHRPRLRRR